LAKVNLAADKSPDKVKESSDDEVDETMLLTKKDVYAKTVDECLHVKLTGHHLKACGTEKPGHKSVLYHAKNTLSQ